jgi:predicted transcriptional regulator
MTKCLSLKQPYAELIVSGRKTIELRKWNTKYRGQFLIHASKTINSEACKLYNIDVSSQVTGAIVGSALLCDVKRYQSKQEFMVDQNKHFAVSAYLEPTYGFLLSDAKRFDKPVPLKGRLGFFNVNI